MHALGFHHEMIRADRNGSVWINFKAISDDVHTLITNKLVDKIQYIKSSITKRAVQDWILLEL